MKHQLDAETKKRLAGLLPANSDFSIEFTPPAYDKIEEEYRPIFTLKPWSEKEVTSIAKKINKTPDDEAYMIDIIRQNVIGWSNMLNISTEEDVPFESADDGGVSPTLFQLIPKAIKVELFQEMARISGIAI